MSRIAVAGDTTRLQIQVVLATHRDSGVNERRP